ncbi:MAG: Crp/Fnr family transcriptional regulator [Cytophagaceae bacterium]|jgi:CRP-like cAMP-binding protein|nr:Crp/Fnr family transcriptional regulator [Cytophagaceae bacterium]
MHTILFDFISRYITLTEEEKNALLELNIFHSVKKGTILVEAGQCTIDNFFVLKGCIRTYYIIEGEEKTTAFYTELEGLNPPCSITKTPSEFYVSCVEDSILVISNDELSIDINRQFPKFDIMCRMLSEEVLAKQILDFDAFKTSTPEQRYLNLIEKRPDLIQRVPQHQLASFLGIKPQSLSRLRARIMDKEKKDDIS